MRRRFIGRGLVTSETRNAAEVIEKFAEYIQVIIPPPRLEPVQSRNSPNISLKRASSRTKSSNRRLAAVSPRKANQVSALADSAHNSIARCARSPRSAKVRMRSDMLRSRGFHGAQCYCERINRN